MLHHLGRKEVDEEVQQANSESVVSGVPTFVIQKEREHQLDGAQDLSENSSWRSLLKLSRLLSLNLSEQDGCKLRHIHDGLFKLLH